MSLLCTELLLLKASLTTCPCSAPSALDAFVCKFSVSIHLVDVHECWPCCTYAVQELATLWMQCWYLTTYFCIVLINILYYEHLLARPISFPKALRSWRFLFRISPRSRTEGLSDLVWLTVDRGFPTPCWYMWQTNARFLLWELRLYALKHIAVECQLQSCTSQNLVQICFFIFRHHQRTTCVKGEIQTLQLLRLPSPKLHFLSFELL